MARSSNRRPPLPATERSARLAAEAGLGDWERSLRVNRASDRSWLWNGVGLWLMLAVLVSLFPVHDGLGVRALLIFSVVVVSVLAVVMTTEAVRRARMGPAFAHLYATGLVLERTKSRATAVSYRGTDADFVTWDHREHARSRARTALWITLPDATTARLVPGNDRERHDTSTLAAHFGLPAHPRPVPRPRTRAPW
jgi:hypothetical protein